MAELTVKTHATYTYETSDGREFEDKDEAMEWQRHLCNIERMCLLDYEYEPADTFKDTVIYVYAKTIEQVNSFNSVMSNYFGYCASLPSTGFFRYNGCLDEYVDIETEIEQLQRIIDKLKEGAKECQTVG